MKGEERRGEERRRVNGRVRREREREVDVGCGQKFGFAGEPTLYLGTY